jgi:hypothetical protein
MSTENPQFPPAPPEFPAHSGGPTSNRLPGAANAVPRAGSERLSSWLLAITCLIVSLVALPVDVFCASRAIRQMNAQSYATTIGTMTRSTIEMHRGARKTSFRPAINYTNVGPQRSGRTAASRETP